MFENFSIELLQHYWWIIISILGSALVFLMFVQGGQSLLFFVAKNHDEKSLIINLVGRKWELTFTTLVTFGGAFFASFPLFYSTSFGGAYWVWMLLLFSFIIQAVSYEFRSKIGNFIGSKTYEVFLTVNGFVAPLVIGAAVGTFFTGSPFFVDEYNLSTWHHPARGLEALFTFPGAFINLSLGLTLFFLSRVLGLQYIIFGIGEADIVQSSRKHLLYEAIGFLFFGVTFLIFLYTSTVFAIASTDGAIIKVAYKYFDNILHVPLALAFQIIGLGLIVMGIFFSSFTQKTSGFWYSGAGAFLLALSLFLIAGFNNTPFYPSTYDLESSLTIYNSSSSKYTLTAMSYVSLFIPFVVAYIAIAWKKMIGKKIDFHEINGKEHIY